MTLSETEPAVGTAGDVVLEARDLTKHFPVRRRARAALSGPRLVVHAVDDVTLTLRRGRVTALVGESGSGKSTVARLLAQLYPRTRGDILLHGRSTLVRRGRRFRAYSGQVQMIFQDPFASLNPVHTVRYHLSRALKIHHRAGRTNTELEEALRVLLQQVQLTPPERYVDKFPHELSGGQRQRVAIARALAADPEALLADEPVSMLDVSIRLGVLNLLRDLKERMHLAILYITHDIASARYFADDTQVMYAGRIVEGGDSESITQNPAHPYTRLLIASAPDPDRIAGAAPADSAPGVNGSASANVSAVSADGLHGSAAAVNDIDDDDDEDDAGEPANLIHPPTGCRFHPRCPYVMDVCRVELPPRFTVSAVDDGDPRGGARDSIPRSDRDSEHWAACWLYGPDGPASAKAAPAPAEDGVPA